MVFIACSLSIVCIHFNDTLAAGLRAATNNFFNFAISKASLGIK